MKSEIEKRVYTVLGEKQQVTNKKNNLSKKKKRRRPISVVIDITDSFFEDFFILKIESL